MLGDKKCNVCDVVLDSSNSLKYNGYIKSPRCRKCDNKHYRDYNRKRAKALKASKWF
tara:strand:- start:1451 stop:1621 length:171 start_codon:yes stop_codon:yes gene_type:complete